MRAKNSLKTSGEEFLAAGIKVWLMTDGQGEYVGQFTSPADGTYVAVTTMNCPSTVKLFVVPSASVYGITNDAVKVDGAKAMRTVDVSKVGTATIRVFSPEDNAFLSAFGDAATTTNITIGSGEPKDAVVKVKVSTADSQYGGIAPGAMVGFDYNISVYDDVILVGAEKQTSIPTLPASDGVDAYYKTNKVVTYTDGIVDLNVKLSTKNGVNPTIYNGDITMHLYDTSTYLAKDAKTTKIGVSDDDGADIAGANPTVVINVD